MHSYQIGMAKSQTNGMMKMSEVCQHCGGQAKLETENDREISGDVCSICFDWMCQNCLDWTYMAELNTVNPICKRCAREKRK